MNSASTISALTSIVVRVPISSAAGATSANPIGISPVVVNQSSEVTRDRAAGGISRPRLVSHRVKP